MQFKPISIALWQALIVRCNAKHVARVIDPDKQDTALRVGKSRHRLSHHAFQNLVSCSLLIVPSETALELETCTLPSLDHLWDLEAEVFLRNVFRHEPVK